MSALTSLHAGSALSYAIAVVLPALDAIVPLVPSETVIIALGVATAGSTDPRLGLLVACAAAGAFLGDNLSYFLGRRFGPHVERRFFATGKGARQRAWAERSLDRFGMQSGRPWEKRRTRHVTVRIQMPQRVLPVRTVSN